MSLVTSWIDQRFYPTHQAKWDDQIFRERILARLLPNSVVLDLGAGAGIVEQMNFRGRAARICGIDLDPRVIDNPMLDEGRIADGACIPYQDASFDLVFADNVLEHLKVPLEVFKEVARVLKPGGVFLFKTPNRRHYVAAIARFTPHKFHQRIVGMRGRTAADVFPTLYRANSRTDVARIAKNAGLCVDRIDVIEGRPEYLRIFWPAYVIGLAYERLVNATPALEAFRVVLIGQLAKPPTPR